jgi:hypothetical protein
MLPKIGLPAGSLVRFALAQPISVAIVDCESVDELEANLAAAQHPFSAEDEEALSVEYDPEEVAAYRGTPKDVKFIEDIVPREGSGSQADPNP